MTSENRPLIQESSTSSPNVIRLGDVLWCSLYGFGRLYYPDTAFLVRVVGFVRSDLTGDEQVHVEALNRSDHFDVENEWNVPHRWLRRTLPEVA